MDPGVRTQGISFLINQEVEIGIQLFSFQKELPRMIVICVFFPSIRDVLSVERCLIHMKTFC